MELLHYLQSDIIIQRADSAVWIILGVVVLGIGLLIRRVNSVSLRRMERGRGPETLQDVERKRKAKKKRKALPVELEDDPDEVSEPKKKDKKRKPPEPQPEPEPEPEPDGPDLLLPEGKALSEGLSKTRSDGFVGRLSKLFQGKAIDESLIDGIEEVLFTADIGVKTSTKLLDSLRAKLSAKELSNSDAIWAHLRAESQAILNGVVPSKSMDFEKSGESPYVVLVIGVNGAGKTTTIGKLANRLATEGKSVLLGAGDTFRAAASDQLGIWSRRVGATLIEGEDGQDPSSVLFDAVKKGVEQNTDVIICDTAGRLHTATNLVEELKKVHRVIGKALPGAPHEVLLVLDATNGQNAIQQAQTFGEALGVSGIALTKLDGTAKGGVVLGICDELKVPINWIGIGERTEDLRPFDAEPFVDALFDGN